MTSRSRSLRALAALLPLAVAACGDDGASSADAATDTAVATDAGGDDLGDTSPGADAAPDGVSEDTAAPVDTTPARTTFAWEPLTVGDATPVWGPMIVGDLMIGGVDALSKVHNEVSQVSLVDGALVAGELGDLGTGRYCGCAFYDPGRAELVTVGGRDRNFAEVESIVLFHADTGATEAIVDADVASYPVGCSAFWSPPGGVAYVYGGSSNRLRGFTDATYRWDPEQRTFTKLAGAGPAARYDATVRPTDDGGAILVSGMGLGGTSVRFYDDLWRFDPGKETWTEIEPATSARPPGRRFAWAALAPDESVLLFGFGSDSPTGQHDVRDLWRFDMATRVWSELDIDGDLPPGRAFTSNLPIADGEAGVLAFGADAAGKAQPDAWVLRVPDALRGRWH